MKLLGIHGVGSCKSVMRSDRPCHCMPRPRMPSAPPMMRSAAKNNAGPIVLANAGTSVVRLRKRALSRRANSNPGMAILFACFPGSLCYHNASAGMLEKPGEQS